MRAAPDPPHDVTAERQCMCFADVHTELFADIGDERQPSMPADPSWCTSFGRCLRADDALP